MFYQTMFHDGLNDAMLIKINISSLRMIRSDRSYESEPSLVARPVIRLDTAHYAIGLKVLRGMLNRDWLKVAFRVYDQS